MYENADELDTCFKIIIISIKNEFYGRILKANLRWSPTRAKFCQLIASLCVILSKFDQTQT